MGKQYSPTNLRAFEVALDTFDKKVKGRMAQILVKTATGCYEEIVATSPCKTGSYIASHRISVNSIDGSDTVYSKENAVPETAAKATALLQLEKLKGVKDTDTIYISNSVGFSNANHYSWAANVEYTGWEGRGPYLIYEKAAMFAMNRIPQYVSYVTKSGEGV
jgi:hypothetical protein